jgi:hypothetical protein
MPFFANADKTGNDIYLSVESFSYSEPAPIDQIIDGLEGPEPESGEVAFTFNHAEIGGNFGAWQVGVFARYDYLLEFNSDTVDLFYRDANDLPFPIDRTYNVNLEPNHIQAEGIGVSYRFAVTPSLSITPRINYLQADVVTRGYLRGEIIADEDGDYQGELSLNYIYEEDILLDRERESISGDGFSLDVSAHWQIAPKWSLSAYLKDYYSEITWDDVTFTQAQANTNTVSFDEEGRLDSIPVLSGREGFRSFTQSLPQRGKVIVNHQMTKVFSLTAQVDHVEEYVYSRLAWQANWGGWGIASGYQFETEAFDVAFNSKYFSLKLIADSTDTEKAHTFGLNMNVSIPVF